MLKKSELVWSKRIQYGSWQSFDKHLSLGGSSDFEFVEWQSNILVGGRAIVLRSNERSDTFYNGRIDFPGVAANFWFMLDVGHCYHVTITFLKLYLRDTIYEYCRKEQFSERMPTEDCGLEVLTTKSRAALASWKSSSQDRLTQDGTVGYTIAREGPLISDYTGAEPKHGES